MRQEILAGMERGRRWSWEDKLRTLSEVGLEGASVSEVARRHDVTRQHLYQWRRELRLRHLAASGQPALVAVKIHDDPAMPAATPPMGHKADHERIEIVLGNGRILRASIALPDAVLMRLIRLAEAA